MLEHPSGWLALSAGNRRFPENARGGFVAYREVGEHLVTLGGVHAAGTDREAILDAFLARARRRRRRVVALQVRPAERALFRARGFAVNRFGATYALRLDGFDLGGSRRSKLRQKIGRAGRLGLEVLEVGRELPAGRSTHRRLGEIGSAWLREKGGRELRFLVGELGTPGESRRRIFVAVAPGRGWVGFVTYVPVGGERPGWLHDLTRRIPAAPPGTMEAINARAIERFRAEGAAYLHLGFTPFVPVGDEDPSADPWARRLTGLLWRRGEAIYPARRQRRYKEKWAPDVVEPEYAAFRPFSASAVLALLRVTGVL